MSYALEVDLEAEAELEESAAAWYEQRSPGTGLRFLAAIDAVMERLASAPEQFPRWRDDRRYRRAMVRRFPFVVVFVLQREVVRVVAISHARREPGYWR